MRPSWLALVVACAVSLALPRLAHADDPAMPPPPPDTAPEAAAPSALPAAAEPEPAELPPPSAPLVVTPVVESWYGWETLVVDGASVSLMTMAAASDNQGAQGPFALGGVVGFSLGAPIVHAAHGRWGIAAADVAMRVGGVFLGGLIGTGIGAATCTREESSGFLGCLGTRTACSSAPSAAR
jgi:hypothetical protein